MNKRAVELADKFLSAEHQTKELLVSIISEALDEYIPTKKECLITALALSGQLDTCPTDLDVAVWQLDQLGLPDNYVKETIELYGGFTFEQLNEEFSKISPFICEL